MAVISLSSVFSRYKKSILFTLFLTSIENVLGLLRPLLLGYAIDSLIQKDVQFFFIYLAIELFLLAIGIGRRLLDTRVYSKIYKNLAISFTTNDNAKNVGVPKLVARSGMLQELVEFFEHDLPATYYSLFNIVGGLIILLILAPFLVVICVLMLLLAAIVYRVSYGRIFSINALINNEHERRVLVLETNCFSRISRHFKRIVKFSIHLSDNEAINFGIIGLGLIALIGVSIYYSSFVLGLSTGITFSTLTYIVQFSEGLIILPLVFQQLIRLRENSTRLHI